MQIMHKTVEIKKWQTHIIKLLMNIMQVVYTFNQKCICIISFTHKNVAFFTHNYFSSLVAKKSNLIQTRERLVDVYRIVDNNRRCAPVTIQMLKRERYFYFSCLYKFFLFQPRHKFYYYTTCFLRVRGLLQIATTVNGFSSHLIFRAYATIRCTFC